MAKPTNHYNLGLFTSVGYSSWSRAFLPLARAAIFNRQASLKLTSKAT